MLQQFKILLLLTTLILSLNIFAKNQGQVQLLEPEAISSQLKNKDIIILDVRTPREYKEGHLEKAMLINAYDPNFKKMIEDLKMKKSFNQKTFLVYCHSGRRSYFASEYMKSIGFKKIIDMKGGIVSWKNQKLKIKK